MGPVIRNVIRDCIRPVMGDEALVSRFSPAASDYFKRLDAAGLRVSIYDDANARLIDRLVANGGNFWPASGAFCAMAGYLYPGNGADLIPLKDGHDAGTLNAFVTGDWNAVTGLKGDGSTKYVDSNRNDNVDGQNDFSMGCFLTSYTLGNTFFLSNDAGTVDNFLLVTPSPDFELLARNRVALSSEKSGALNSAGYVGTSRSVSASYTARRNEETYTITSSSLTPNGSRINVFSSSVGTGFSDARLPFYHIGPNLNGAGELAELDTILTDWQTDLANA